MDLIQARNRHTHDSAFVAYLTRKMYSITERAMPVNTEGRSVCGEERFPLSPHKRRIDHMVEKTRAIFLPQKDESTRYKFCRLHIDQTNRTYRESLRLRKTRISMLQSEERENEKENIVDEADEFSDNTSNENIETDDE